MPSKPPADDAALNLDAQLTELEAEWRREYEASIAARAAYQTLAQNMRSACELIDAACERLERAEARKARVLSKIERLENRLFPHD